jgi:hypothetical protein
MKTNKKAFIERSYERFCLINIELNPSRNIVKELAEQYYGNNQIYAMYITAD